MIETKQIEFNVAKIETIVANHANETLVVRVKGSTIVIAIVTGFNKMNGQMKPIYQTVVTYKAK